MSAKENDSRELRQAERRERKSTAAAEKEKKDRRYRRNVIIFIAVFVVVIVAALLINSNIFYTATTALTVGDTKYSPAEVSYFYRSTLNGIYQNLQSQLGDMTSMVLDINTPLSEQTYPYDLDGNKTWADAIMDNARDDMVRITSFYDAAVREGYTMTNTDQAYVDSMLAQLQEYASSNGFASFDKFLSAYYGKGLNSKTLTKLLERVALASEYSSRLLDSLTYTDDELAAYYDAHADELDYYDYYAYTVSGTLPLFSELDDETKAEKVHATAEKIVADSTDVESYLAAVAAFAGEDTKLSVNAYRSNNIPSYYRDWVTDSARQPGDVAVFDADTTAASYAVFFIGHDRNDYNTVDFRHILVMAEADENGEYPEEVLLAARVKAEELLKQWEQDPTEENFAALANENSEDSGSNTNGGLYEKVTKYTMVPGVNSFLFEEGHSVGDTGVVLGESSSYTGYHVMYYVGENRRNADILAEDKKRDEDYDAKYAELSAPYTVKDGFGMRFVTL